MRTFTVEPSRETENYMEMCLGLFYAPSRSIPEEVNIESVIFIINKTKSQIIACLQFLFLNGQ
jgi:hypothetical protein